MRTTFEGNSASEREPFRIALFDRDHRLAGIPRQCADHAPRLDLDWFKRHNCQPIDSYRGLTHRSK
jgi:hypothetical protein